MQTNDERIDLGIQTDEILESNLWTQHPSELHRECGTGLVLDALAKSQDQLSSIPFFKDMVNAFESKKPESFNINLSFNQNTILKLLNKSANVTIASRNHAVDRQINSFSILTGPGCFV